jgi:hypothetical protein
VASRGSQPSHATNHFWKLALRGAELQKGTVLRGCLSPEAIITAFSTQGCPTASPQCGSRHVPIPTTGFLLLEVFLAEEEEVAAAQLGWCQVHLHLPPGSWLFVDMM